MHLSYETKTQKRGWENVHLKSEVHATQKLRSLKDG